MSVILDACEGMKEWPPRWRAVAICLARGETAVSIQEAGLMSAVNISRGRHKGTKWFTPEQFESAIILLQERIFCSRGHWLALVEKRMNEKMAASKKATEKELLEIARDILCEAEEPGSRMRGSMSVDIEGAFDPDIMAAGTDYISKLFEKARYGEPGSNGGHSEGGNGEMKEGGQADTDQDA